MVSPDRKTSTTELFLTNFERKKERKKKFQSGRSIQLVSSPTSKSPVRTLKNMKETQNSRRHNYQHLIPQCSMKHH